MSFIRTLTYRAKIFCIRREDIPYPVPEGYCPDNSYESVWKDFNAEEEADSFETSLNIWRDNILENEIDILIEDGDDKCQDLSESLHICSYQLKDIETNEIEKIEKAKIKISKVPKFIFSEIEYLEEQKEHETNKEMKDNIQKAIDRLKEMYFLK